MVKHNKTPYNPSLKVVDPTQPRPSPQKLLWKCPSCKRVRCYQGPLVIKVCHACQVPMKICNLFTHEPTPDYNTTYESEEMLQTQLSNCCNAIIIDNTDICSECKEHCSPTTEKPEHIWMEENDPHGELQEEFCN